jgi:hypothetical protein
MIIKTKTGEVVVVYPHPTKSVYVNALDCITEYIKNEVEIIK